MAGRAEGRWLTPTWAHPSSGRGLSEQLRLRHCESKRRSSAARENLRPSASRDRDRARGAAAAGAAGGAAAAPAASGAAAAARAAPATAAPWPPPRPARSRPPKPGPPWQSQQVWHRGCWHTPQCQPCCLYPSGSTLPQGHFFFPIPAQSSRQTDVML